MLTTYQKYYQKGKRCHLRRRKERQKQLPLLQNMVDLSHAQELQHVSALFDSRHIIDQLALQDLSVNGQLANYRAKTVSLDHKLIYS